MTQSTQGVHTTRGRDFRQLSEADHFAIAELCLPGAALGSYSLPHDARLIAATAAGSRVTSIDGRSYIDYVGGAGANILGHCHPVVVEAVREQARRGLHYFGVLNDRAVELAETLRDLIPCCEKLVFTTTGSEATALAMRMARAATGRNRIMKFEGAYHGNHDYSCFAVFPSTPSQYPIGKPDSGGIPPVVQDLVLVSPYNDIEAAKQLIEEYRHDLAAVVVEPIQRIIFAKPDFIAGLRRVCTENDVLLIFDEVVTGFRLALGGGQEFYGVTPDLATYGKIIGGGGPLGCVAGRADIIETANPARRGHPEYAYVNGTLHGNPLAAAAALATLSVLQQPGFYHALVRKTEDLLSKLQRVLTGHGIPALATGRNSFWQILFTHGEPSSQADIMNSDVARMRKLDIELLKRGVYVLPGVRRFVAAVNSQEDFEDTAKALDDACRAIAATRR